MSSSLDSGDTLAVPGALTHYGDGGERSEEEAQPGPQRQHRGPSWLSHSECWGLLTRNCCSSSPCLGFLPYLGEVMNSCKDSVRAQEGQGRQQELSDHCCRNQW